MTMQKESKIQRGTPQKERDRKNRNNEEYVEMLAEQYHKEMPHLTLEQIKRELSLVM